MALNVFNDHDGVIGQQADGNDNCGQGHHVELKTQQFHKGKGEHIGKGQGQGRDKRGPGITEKKENNTKGHDDRIPERTEHIIHGQVNEPALGVGQLHVEHGKFLFDLRQLFLYLGNHLAGVTVFTAKQRDRHCGFAVAPINGGRIRPAPADRTEIRHPDVGAMGHRHHNGADISGPLGQGLRRQQIAISPAMNQAGGDGHIGTGERACHFGRGQAMGLKFVAVKINSHFNAVTTEHLGLGHSRNPKELVPQLIFRQSPYAGGIKPDTGGRSQTEYHQRFCGIGNLEDKRFPDPGRQQAPDPAQFGDHLGGGHINVIAVFKLHLDGGYLVLGGGGHPAHTVNCGKTDLNGMGHFGGHVIGRRPGPLGHHRNHRPVGLGKKIHGQGGIGKHSRHHPDQDNGDNGMGIAEKPLHGAHGNSPGAMVTGSPSCSCKRTLSWATTTRSPALSAPVTAMAS